MPELQQVALEYADRGVELVTVVVNGDYRRARGIVARVGLSAPVIIADGDLQRVYHVDAVPWTVIIGRDGRAKSVLRGGQSADQFRKAIDKQL